MSYASNHKTPVHVLIDCYNIPLINCNHVFREPKENAIQRTYRKLDKTSPYLVFTAYECSWYIATIDQKCLFCIESITLFIDRSNSEINSFLLYVFRNWSTQLCVMMFRMKGFPAMGYCESGKSIVRCFGDKFSFYLFTWTD